MNRILRSRAELERRVAKLVYGSAAHDERYWAELGTMSYNRLLQELRYWERETEMEAAHV